MIRNNGTSDNKKKQNILFLTGPNEADKWMYLLAKDLESKINSTSYFISLMRRSTDMLLDKGVEADRIFEIIWEEQKKISVPSLKFLEDSEKKYKFRLWDLWTITSFRKRDRQRLKNSIVYCYFEYVIKEIESMFRKVKPSFIIIYGPASFQDMIMIHMAKEKGAEIIELTTSRIPSRFTIADGLGNWPLLDKEYESIKRNGMGKKEEKITNNFIKHCINAPLTQDCVVKYKESFFNSIKRYLHYLKIIIKYKKLPDFTITVAPMVIWPIKQKLFQILNHFEEPINGEKYIFFPLHFQPEASTLIYGKWYLDQVALIENISKAIPLGYKLYVKEHSYGFGSRPFNYYKRLKKLPNVRLISPYTNTTDLIKKSSLVVTITGTVGWEACLLGKRVLTLGDIFYNTFDEVVKVKEIEELSNLIFKNLDKEINEKQLIYFVAAVFRSTFPGLTRLPSDCKDICLESKNISNLTDGIKNYIHQMKMLE